MASNLTRFNPLGDIARLSPYRNLDEFFEDFPMMSSWGGMEAAPRMRMDIAESEQAFTINAEIPGVKKEDIKIAIEGDKVTIRAEVKKETEEQKEGNQVRSERYYGQQYRSFTLPQAVDDSKAEAKYKDGILSLTLPKKAGGTAKHLTVQ